MSWARVGKDWHHPGQHTPSVRRLDVPRDGRVTVTGRVYKLHLAGTGIRAAIRHNDREVWNAEIEGQDAKGKPHDFTLEVIQGDSLRFIVDKRGHIACDTTYWDPAVVYADGETLQASAAFDAKRQGENGWFYEMYVEDPSKLRQRVATEARPEALPEPPTENLPPEAARKQVEIEWAFQLGDRPIDKAAEEELTRAHRILNRQTDRLDEATVAGVAAANRRAETRTRKSFC